MLGGDLMIRPVPKFAGRSPDVYHEEGPSFAGRRPDDSSRTQIRWEES